jgi:hypothetical protein
MGLSSKVGVSTHVILKILGVSDLLQQPSHVTYVFSKYFGYQSKHLNHFDGDIMNSNNV